MTKKQTKEQATKTETETKTRIIRVVEVTSPKTGRPILIGPNASGGFSPSAVERYGVKQVDEWTEIEAAGWADATAKFRAGEGRKVKAAKATTEKAAASSGPRKKPAAKKTATRKKPARKATATKT